MLTARLHENLKLLVIRIDGEFTRESFMAECGPEINKVYARHSDGAAPNRLLDFRRTTIHVETEDVKRMVDGFRGMNQVIGPGRTAFLVSTDLMFGVLRQYEQFGVGQSIQRCVFRDAADALGWLGIDPGKTQELELGS